MNKRSFRFTALIGWLDRPTVDGRVWRPLGGIVELRNGRPISLLALSDGLMECGPVGYISKLAVHHSDGAVYATGRAESDIADALNEGHFVLLADLDSSVEVEDNPDEISYLQVVLMAAHVGPPALFPWKEPA